MRSKWNRGLVVLTALVACTAGSVHAKTVRGSGNSSREVHDFNGLRGVINATQGDLELKLGGDERLEIEMDDNLHQYLELDVDDGVLEIRFERGVHVRTDSPMRMRLTLGELTYLGMPGSGDTSAEKLECGDLRLSLTGSGDVRVRTLTAGKLEAGLSGSGDVDLDEIRAEEVHLALSGSGNFESGKLHARTLEAKLIGSGDIDVAGEVTEEEVRISGSGHVDAEDLTSESAHVRISGSGDARVHVKRELAVRLTGSGDVRFRGEPTITRRVTGSGDLRRI